MVPPGYLYVYRQQLYQTTVTLLTAQAQMRGKQVTGEIWRNAWIGRRPVVQLTFDPDVSGGWFPPLTHIVMALNRFL